VNRSIGTAAAGRLMELRERAGCSWMPFVAWACLALAGCAASPRAPTPARQPTPAPAPVLLYKQTPRADEFGRIVVPVELNGQGPFFFLLDTGAARSALTQAATERLGIRVDDRHDVFVRGVSGRTRVHTTVIDSFRVGDMEFLQQRLPVLRSQVLEGLDGILSMDRLRDLHLTADFASAEIRIMNRGLGDTPPESLPMRFSELYRQLIVVDARIGKHRVPAIIDTGGTHTLGNVALLNTLIADAGGTLDGVVRAKVTDATDTVLDTWDSQVDSLSIGPVALDDLRVSFGRFPVFQFWQLNEKPALLIGMDALRQMKSLSVDYRRRRMVVAAREVAD
jgi:predicted aspartyl protease